MEFYLIIGIVFVLSIFLKINQNKIRGSVGESLTENKLKLSRLFGKDGYILKNIYIPKSNGETSEIDLLFITKKGIFVIESKNYSGYIFGSEQNQNWTVTLYAGKGFFGINKVEKHQFYNPIKQNKTHIKNLKEFIGKDVPCFSIIVFSNRCELKEINVFSDNVYVCYRDEINRIISRIWKKNEDVLSDNEVFNLNELLSKHTGVDKEIKKKHVDQIVDKYSSNTICPKCGGKLVLRSAKKGPYAGNTFYGCSNYPKCKYVKNTENF